MKKEYKTEITNMVMVEDGKGKVLVQERKLYWKGIAFPGGHIEPGESFEESAEREVFEETGLSVRNLKMCGIVHWDNPEKTEKYIVLCYKTHEFTGSLIPETEEGRVFWAEKNELRGMKLCKNFDRYLELFLGDDSFEFYGKYR